MAASNEVAARIMEHLVAHDGDGGHGYSQGSNRWGNGVLETLEIDGHASRFAGATAIAPPALSAPTRQPEWIAGAPLTPATCAFTCAARATSNGSR